MVWIGCNCINHFSGLENVQCEVLAFTRRLHWSNLLVIWWRSLERFCCPLTRSNSLGYVLKANLHKDFVSTLKTWARSKWLKFILCELTNVWVILMVAARLLKTIHYIEKDDDWHITLSVLLAYENPKNAQKSYKIFKPTGSDKIVAMVPFFLSLSPLQCWSASERHAVKTTFEDEGGQVRAI